MIWTGGRRPQVNVVLQADAVVQADIGIGGAHAGEPRHIALQERRRIVEMPTGSAGVRFDPPGTPLLHFPMPDQ